MSVPRKKICMLAATPLTIHFFLKPHLVQLAKNHDVTLMVNLKNDSYLPPLELPITIIDIGISRKIAPISDLLCLMKLVYLFHKTKYDLLITVVPKAGLLGMLAGLVARIPQRLHIFQGEVWASKSGINRKVLKLTDKVTAFCATNLLAVSQSEKKFLVDQRITTAKKIKVLGAGSISGVDITKYSSVITERVKIRKKLVIPDDAVVVIFVGRICRDKGVYDLCNAFSTLDIQCPNLWLLLVGPDEESILSTLLYGLGKSSKRTKVIGYVSNPEVYMAAADFICLPSYREGFGVVVIEAASLGLPAIGSNIYGLSDAIQDGITGILFEKGSVESLRRALVTLYDNIALRRSLGDSAKDFAMSNFDTKKVIDRYVTYIEELLFELPNHYYDVDKTQTRN